MAQDIKPEEVIAHNDVRINCNRCDLGVQEDIQQMQWSCADSTVVWSWVTKLVREAGALAKNFQLTLAQALLGARVPVARRKIPMKLWEVLGGQANWEIWKTRSKWIHKNCRSAPTEIIISIWSQVRQYLIIAWAEYMSQVDNSKLSIDKAESSFRKDFGSIHKLWLIDATTLQVRYTPN
jgi:hypothetical protein